MPVVYSLTDLTGRNRNENRRMVVATFEVKRRTFLISVLSVVASMPITTIVGFLFGVYALAVPVVFVVGGIWLWDSRQRKGLKLLNYQAIVDGRKASNGVLYAAGQPVPKPQLVMHQRQFIPLVDNERGTPVVLGSDNLSISRTGRGRKPNAEARFT
ncbi:MULTISPECIES: hypothetical protein [Microbacterium]|uniref:Uncharacterized protein n=1 Tax=Microbacterium hominis TaxID=162426 RepID=A0A2K9DUX6_9MICO|nr:MULTISPECIES: hypothetical protein [Microbacterium]AUG29564.1 hypothetical protein CXR34_08955 [Microbacterium hominis]EPD84271.1 hypothetical protein HMPREF1529_02336 [Microbacterium sp. oral taxon 186 str. F0373]